MESNAETYELHLPDDINDDVSVESKEYSRTEWYGVDTAPSYDARLVRVSKALEAIEAPGDFFTCGATASFPQPGIVVNGFGDLPLPLTKNTARALIQLCQLAPFGHGEQTIVDVNVRNTWQLSSTQFRIDNPAWQSFIRDIVVSCYIPLGFRSAMRVEAKLHKLLVYEAGGKFERHQDSEKEDGMLGTLVVVLPCRFTGGRLLVHDPVASTSVMETTKVQTWDAGAMDPLALKYAAFYGDCPHEIEPVTHGYRLCLTYNLVCEEAAHLDFHYASNLPVYESLKAALGDYFSQSDQENEDYATARSKQYAREMEPKPAKPFVLTDPSTHRHAKLIYALEHKYTQCGLSFKYLKNKDALVAANFVRLCEQSGGAFELFLVKSKYVRKWEYFTRDQVDQEEDLETVEKYVYLRQPWAPYRSSTLPSGQKLQSNFVYGELEKDVAPCGHFDKVQFDQLVNTGYSGNETSSVERWYESAVLVLAPLCESWRLRFDQYKHRYMDVGEPLNELWLPLATSHPVNAVFVASLYGVYADAWSMTDPQAEAVLEAVAKLKNIHVLEDILVGCGRISRQPKLQAVCAIFEWEDVVAMAKATKRRWLNRSNTFHLVLTLLRGVLDVQRISSLLSAVLPEPEDGSNGYDLVVDECKTPLDQYIQLLRLASLVSEELVRALAQLGSAPALVQLVVPALLSLSEHGSHLSALQEARTRLEQSLPELRHAWYKYHRNWYCPSAFTRSKCAMCVSIKEMLASQDTLQVECAADKFDRHPEPNKLESVGLERRPVPGSPNTIALVKVYESAVYKEAIKEMAQLDEVLALGWAGAKTKRAFQ